MSLAAKHINNNSSEASLREELRELKNLIVEIRDKKPGPKPKKKQVSYQRDELVCDDIHIMPSDPEDQNITLILITKEKSKSMLPQDVIEMTREQFDDLTNNILDGRSGKKIKVRDYTLKDSRAIYVEDYGWEITDGIESY